MKVQITCLTILLFLFSGCRKTEVEHLDLKGTIKGQIFTLDEFANTISDNANCHVVLDGGTTSYSTVTDTSGSYVITDIPTGTYIIIISKEGYSTIRTEDIKIVGGENPIWYNTTIIENSKTTIENFSLENVNDTIFMNGIIHHDYIIGQFINQHPRILYFVSDKKDVSSSNYIYGSIFYFMYDSGSPMKQILYTGLFFPHGTKIYVIAYGGNRIIPDNYDIDSDQYSFSGLGKPSNVASIIIP